MPENDEPKIHVDEDWKAKVEREKAVADEQTLAEEEQPELSPFEYHISGIAAQAVMALGLMGQEGEKVMVDLDYANHLISALHMLKEKTEGNRTESETANLDEAISELERAFAVRMQQAQEARFNQPSIDPNPPFLKP